MSDSDRPQRVLVTGASGFVGGRVVESMLLSGFATPVAAIRRWSGAARVATLAAECAIVDILDEGQVDGAVAGVDAIVHCAYTDDRDSIVTGTKNLLDAALRHGVDRFVFLSTAEVYGPAVRGPVTEQDPTPTTGRPYGDAKIEAENLCRSYHARGLKPVIFRPSLIYGPYSASWSMNIAARLKSGNWGIFEEFGEGIANLIYVDDLVRAIFLALEREEARGETFNVNSPEQITWNDYFQRFNTALALPPLRKISATQSKMRTRVMDGLGYVTSFFVSRFKDQLMEIYLRGGWASKVMKLIKGELKSTPSGGELNDLFHRQAFYQDTKVRTLIGYEPRFHLDQGLELTVAWLRLHELA